MPMSHRARGADTVWVRRWWLWKELERFGFYLFLWYHALYHHRLQQIGHTQSAVYRSLYHMAGMSYTAVHSVRMAGKPDGCACADPGGLRSFAISRRPHGRVAQNDSRCLHSFADPVSIHERGAHPDMAALMASQTQNGYAVPGDLRDYGAHDGRWCHSCLGVSLSVQNSPTTPRATRCSLRSRVRQATRTLRSTWNSLASMASPCSQMR